MTRLKEKSERHAERRENQQQEFNASACEKYPMEVSVDKAMKIMRNWDKNATTCKPTKSAFDATLMFYANYGYF